MEYKVLRPPLAETFELPNREELLRLKAGDSVKLRFQVGNDTPERMWVVLKDCSSTNEWTGLIDNDATQHETVKSLPAGILVRFHPLDIIAIE